MSKEPRFRVAYVMQPTHDFSALKPYTEDIVFVTSGYEPTSQLWGKISKALESFDPARDLIVAVGRINASLITGMVLSRHWPEVDCTIAVYVSNSTEPYHFLKVPGTG